MPKTGISPLVYITAELKSRDLESRLLIAAHLLNAGYSVIFGQQWALIGNAPTAMPGCYLFKTANAIQAGWMKQCDRHLVVASDEEALPFAGKEFLVNIDPAAFEASDLFLVQSDAHRHILEQTFPACRGRLKVVGSPRLDLLECSKSTYAAEVEQIHRTVGSYVLFNTGFGLVNSVWGSVEAAVKAMLQGAGVTPEEIRERVINEQLCLEHTAALIRWAAQHTKVVIRPHPSENAATWRDAFPATVIEGSSPTPWMLGAKVMIHSNSTTGIEAAILGVPCLNIDPTKDWGQHFIMQDINQTVKSAQEAADVLAAVIAKDKARLAPRFSSARIGPREGAKKTAQAVAALFAKNGIAPGKLPTGYGWSPGTRDENTKQKFTVTAEEMNIQCQKIFAIAGTKNVETMQLDDSVFLMVPGKYAPG